MSESSMPAGEYLEALLALPQLYRAAVSPDGRWVAWTWYNAGPAADVYAVPTDGGAAPTRLTDTAEDTVLVSWSPDSRALVVAQDHDGDERATLYLVEIDRPGDMRALTELSPSYFIRGGELHPNGRWLIYAANCDVATGAVIEPSPIIRHDLHTGERRVLAMPERPIWAAPTLNVQGTHVLYSRNDRHPAGEQAWLVDIDGREDREIISAGPDKKVAASWLPDGRRILVVAEADTHRRVGLWSMDDEQVRWLIDDPSRNVEHAWVPKGSNRAVIVEYAAARCRPSLLDLDSGAEQALRPPSGELIPLAPAATGGWVAQYGSSTQPNDLMRFRPEQAGSADFTSLTRIWERTPIRATMLVGAEDFRWRSIDGLEAQGWLYRTREAAAGTVICVHGGPTYHSREEVDAQIQYLLSQGFNVLDPNYRGSTGFGRAYQEAIKEDGWGGREQHDLSTGIEALIAAGIAEPGKVGMTGTSYGGYSSWCGITRMPRRLLAAAVPICGMTDLVVDYETTRPDLRPYSEEMMGGRPDQVPERYRERSPLHSISRIRGRLLIVQGLRDPNVTPENVRVVREALDRAGIAYEVLAFADEGHGIARPANQRVLYQRMATFFRAAFQAGEGAD